MTLDCGFCPQSARGKRPVPMWADAFLRDTMHLETDEIGAYHLIIYAMWKRKDCSLVNDPKRLAKIARVSTRLWNARIGPVILDFFDLKDGVVSSKKLLKEAKFVEESVTAQHARKCDACKKRGTYAKPPVKAYSDEYGEINSRKPLEINDVGLTVDVTTEEPDTGPPINLPNNPTIDGGGGSACARKPDPKKVEVETDREVILSAIGADPISGIVGPNGTQIGRMSDMIEARKWGADLGLTLPEIVDVIKDVMSRKTDGPPSSFSYFSKAMQRFAWQKSKPTLTPIEGGACREHTNHNSRAERGNNAASRAHDNLIAAFSRTIPQDP